MFSVLLDHKLVEEVGMASRDGREKGTTCMSNAAPRVPWIALVLLALASWGALIYLVMTYAATTWAMMVFFPLWFLAVFSLSLLLLWLVYARMVRWYPGRPRAVLRQAVEIAAFFSLVALLQMLFGLDLAVLLAMAALFGLMEAFFLQRGRRGT